MKLSGGTMTGHIILNNAVLTSQYQAISRSTGNAFFVQITNPYVYHQFNMVKNKIINLGDPTDATDAINLRTLNKHFIKPSDHTNRFAYLMDPTNGLLQWTDLLTDSIAIISIGDLNATSGNYHTYNKKVIFASIKKNSEGGYKRCYPLQKDKEYTLCLEILTTDYQLWHKSVITVDITTSQGVTVKDGMSISTHISIEHLPIRLNICMYIYKLQTRPSGVVFIGLRPNIHFTNMFIANIEEGGLRIKNKPVSLRLFGKKSFTFCLVMQLWLNRNMYIKTFMRDGAHEKPHLIYDKTSKKLKLQTNGLRAGSTNETSITLLDSFNGKRVLFWLTKKGTGGDFTVKASISNYSGTLTISSELASQSNCTFRISSEDATIYRIMYCPNFYDLDSHEFHQIILQEKLNGSYIL